MSSIKQRQNQQLKKVLKSHRGGHKKSYKATSLMFPVFFPEWDRIMQEFHIAMGNLAEGFITGVTEALKPLAISPELQEALQVFDTDNKPIKYKDLPTILVNTLGGEPSEVKETPTGRIYIFKPETGEPPKYVSGRLVDMDFKPELPKQYEPLTDAVQRIRETPPIMLTGRILQPREPEIVKPVVYTEPNYEEDNTDGLGKL